MCFLFSGHFLLRLLLLFFQFILDSVGPLAFCKTLLKYTKEVRGKKELKKRLEEKVKEDKRKRQGEAGRGRKSHHSGWGRKKGGREEGEWMFLNLLRLVAGCCCNCRKHKWANGSLSPMHSTEEGANKLLRLLLSIFLLGFSSSSSFFFSFSFSSFSSPLPSPRLLLIFLLGFSSFWRSPCLSSSSPPFSLEFFSSFSSFAFPPYLLPPPPNCSPIFSHPSISFFPHITGNPSSIPSLGG